MTILNTSELSLDDVPTKYEWSLFSKFALMFDPLNDSHASEFYPIKLSELPSIDDTVVAIRGYLYRLQRINNQSLTDEPSLDAKVLKAYSILASKLSRNNEIDK